MRGLQLRPWRSASTLTMPPPDAPSTSRRVELVLQRPASSAAWPGPASSSPSGPSSSFTPGRIVRSACGRPRRRHRSSSASGSAGGAASASTAASRRASRTSTISAPGKRASTACTSGWPARAARGARARRPARCSCSVAAPGSEETATTQRRPVQSLERARRGRSARSRLRALGERELDPALLEAHEPHVALQRAASARCRAARRPARPRPRSGAGAPRRGLRLGRARPDAAAAWRPSPSAALPRRGRTPPAGARGSGAGRRAGRGRAVLAGARSASSGVGRSAA